MKVQQMRAISLIVFTWISKIWRVAWEENLSQTFIARRNAKKSELTLVETSIFFDYAQNEPWEDI